MLVRVVSLTCGIASQNYRRKFTNPCHTSRTFGHEWRAFVWGGSVWGRENGMATSRRCIAAGAWLLAAGLLSGSGAAMAFADAGSHAGKHANSASEAKRHAASSEGGTKHDATAATGGEARSAHQKAATTHGVDPVSEPTTQITRSATTQMSAREIVADAGPTNDDMEPSGDPTPPTGTAPTDEVASSPTPDDPPPTQTPPPPTDVAPPTDDASEPDTSAATVPAFPTYDASALGSDQVPSASNTASSDTTAGSTAPDLGQQDASQPPLPPDPAPPTPDVTTVSEAELTPPTDTVAPPTQVPAAPEEDAAVAAVQRATEDENNRRRSAGLDERGLSPLQILRLLTRTSGSAFAGGTTANPTLLDVSDEMPWGGAASAYGTNAAPAGTSSRSTAAQGPNGAMSAGLQTFLYTYGQIVVVAVSLSAMFVAALPGLAGLVLPAAAGMHIGYRQAKAGRTVRNSGIARLAAPGPIGVVRSGSLIALRRPSRRLPPANSEGRAQQEVA
jgi:hypothetical protein